MSLTLKAFEIVGMVKKDGTELTLSNAANGKENKIQTIPVNDTTYCADIGEYAFVKCIEQEDPLLFFSAPTLTNIIAALVGNNPSHTEKNLTDEHSFVTILYSTKRPIIVSGDSLTRLIASLDTAVRYYTASRQYSDMMGTIVSCILYTLRKASKVNGFVYLT